jgi:hypothetical protein
MWKNVLFKYKAGIKHVSCIRESKHLTWFSDSYNISISVHCP